MARRGMLLAIHLVLLLLVGVVATTVFVHLIERARGYAAHRERVQLRELALSARCLRPGDERRVGVYLVLRSADGRTTRCQHADASWEVVWEGERIVEERHACPGP